MGLDKDSFYRIGLSVILILSFGFLFINIYFMESNIPNLPELGVVNELTNQDYMEDFQYVYDIINDYYPFLQVNKEVNKVDWLANKEDYLNRIGECKNDDEFYRNMQTILFDLNNGHTHLLPTNDVGITMYASYRRVPRMDWKHGMSKIFEKPRVQNRYGITNENVGKILDMENQVPIAGDMENFELGDLKEGEIAYIHIKKMVHPFDEIASFKEEKRQVLNYLNSIGGYGSLLIDIRGNGGGNPAYWSRFLLPSIVGKTYDQRIYSFVKSGQVLEDFLSQYRYKDLRKVDIDKMKFPPITAGMVAEFDKFRHYTYQVIPNEDSIGFKGEIFLLVDGGVFSASEMMASFVKETGLATLVGQRTGGDGLGLDPMLVDLPNSGYVLRFSKEMGVTESGSINEKDRTLPDIEVEDSGRRIYIKDGKIFINGDRCVEKILGIYREKNLVLKPGFFCYRFSFL